mgnify:FL=1
MKISIKAESSSVWEDLNFLTEETEIEYIRVDDFLISPQTVKALSDEFSSISTHSAINAIPGKHLNPRNHIYGLVDLVRQQTLAIHGPLEEILGYTSEVLLSIPFLSLIHESDLDATKIVLSTILQGKQVEEFVFRVHKADGGLEKLKLSGTPADRGILAFYCSPVSSVNRFEGNLVHGYYRGELTGRNNLQFIVEQDHKGFQQSLKSILSNPRSPGEVWHEPIRFRRILASGEFIDVENIVMGADFPKGRIHVLEKSPKEPGNLYHFLYDTLGNILTCRSATDLAGHNVIFSDENASQTEEENYSQ